MTPKCISRIFLKVASFPTDLSCDRLVIWLFGNLALNLSVIYTGISELNVTEKLYDINILMEAQFNLTLILLCADIFKLMCNIKTQFWKWVSRAEGKYRIKQLCLPQLTQKKKSYNAPLIFCMLYLAQLKHSVVTHKTAQGHEWCRSWMFPGIPSV